MSSATFACCSTPSAAVGSSISTTREPQATARPTATAWRWPPDSRPTRAATDGIGSSCGRGPRRSRGHHRLAVEPAQPAQRTGDDLLAAQEHVGPDAQVRRERKVLIHGLDAGLPGVDRGPERDLATVDQNRARSGRERAGDDVDQRRLTCTVVADQSDDFAGVQLHVDAAQRDHAAVPLGQIADLDARQRQAPRSDRAPARCCSPPSPYLRTLGLRTARLTSELPGSPQNCSDA